jgi:FMN phosphatase YigB (HAD superfamily)
VRVTAVVFDVGETLVDETRNWEHAADVAGVPRFTLMALVRAAAARRESPWRAFEWLGVTPSREELRQAVWNDVEPALAAEMVAVHVRRGPWGHLYEAPEQAITIRSLAELPEALP